MLFKLLLSLIVSATTASMAWGQCGCSNCSNTGGAYTEVVNAGVQSDCTGGCNQESCGCNQSSSSCGNSHHWDDPYFDCCRTTPFDYQICDPCCRKPYVSMFGGGTAIDNFNRTLVIDPIADIVEYQGAQVDEGYGMGVAVGYRVHPVVRVELEYSYRFNEAESWFTLTETAGVATASTSEVAAGPVKTHAGMFNVVADLSMRRIRCLNVYGGGGIGMINIDSTITTAADVYTSDNSAFAWQFIGGANFPLSRQVELFTEYRYLGADKLQFNNGAGAVFGDFEYDAHNLFAGVRLYSR